MDSDLLRTEAEARRLSVGDASVVAGGIHGSRKRQRAFQLRKKTTKGTNNPISPEAGKHNNIIIGVASVAAAAEGTGHDSSSWLETNVADEPSSPSPKRRRRGRPKKDVNKKKRGRPPKLKTQMSPEAERAEPTEAEPNEGKRKRGRPKKTSKANLGEETCVPLETHIMLRRSAGPVDVHAQDLAKALEESNKTAEQLLEELADMREQVETLKESLRSEKQNLEELSSKRNQLVSLCQEKESALQAAMIDKQNMEARLSQLNKGELESNTRKELVEATNQVCAAEETKKKLYNEKMLLEERISRLEKKKVDEVRSLEKELEQERKSTKPRIIELERKVEELTRKLAAAESSLALKDAELSSMGINVKEVEYLREMKEMQATQLAEYQALYKEELVLRKKYFNIIEDMKGQD